MQVFLLQCADILVKYKLPEDIQREIINGAMAQSATEVELALGHCRTSGSVFDYVKSSGGSEITPEALIGFHCKTLSELLEEEC